MAILCSIIFFWNIILFSIVDASCYISTSKCTRVSIFPQPHEYLSWVFFSSFKISHPNSVKWYLIVAFPKWLLILSVCLFRCLVAIYISSSEKYLFKFFAHFSIRLVLLLLWWGVEVFHIFWSDAWFANIFSHSVCCLFILLMVPIL